MIRVNCVGCDCVGMGGGQPFPLLPTDTASKNLGNVTVTYTSSLLAMQLSNSSCLLALKHEPIAHGELAPSQVRIESLYLRKSSPYDERWLRKFAKLRVRAGPRALMHKAARRYLALRPRCYSER